ncbi:MAG: hypothetical protein JXR95_10170 [Deltaproteobacteria bacterium]|nr:hypothetical protein [Deltaproteobacteria bacterium]
MKNFLCILAVTVLSVSAGCAFDTTAPDLITTEECEGEAPLGDMQYGVCSGSLKVCIQGKWEEPDYTIIEGFQEHEYSCDFLDNDCDGITDSGDCGEGYCVEGDASVFCGCDEGYEWDEGECKDINECLTHPCDENATCTNINGSYECECKAGYSGNGFSCTENDNCADNACHGDAQCISNDTGYTCECNTGYTGDGFSCIPTSCRRIIMSHPSTPSGYYTINTGTGGEVDVWCDMESDGALGYTMLKLESTLLTTNQDTYREICSAFGMEVIVPRTRAHALSIQDFNDGQIPNIVNVFPKSDGSVGLNNFQGMCNGSPCSFYLSDTNWTYTGTEPSGNNQTAYSLYLWFENGTSWGGWDDSNNYVSPSFQGYVICSTNDTPEPVRESCEEYALTDTVWNHGADGINGTYFITVAGTIHQAHCDQRTDGGGWTMVMNYSHAANTNPDLNVIDTRFVLLGSDTLGTDESSNPDIFGHLSSDMIQKMDFNEMRFYSRTSSHSRIINFSTADNGCIDYFNTGIGNCSPQYNYKAYSDHTAFLPGEVDSGNSDRGDFSLTENPFQKENTYRFTIRGATGVWESDNAVNNSMSSTIHRAFVRKRIQGTSCLDILQNYPGIKSGTYIIDTDGAGPNPAFYTWCDMETEGGGWTMVVYYGYGYWRPVNFTNSYPRPGGSFYHSLATSETFPQTMFQDDANNASIAAVSIDASQLYSLSGGEFLAYVGGSTDDYITGVLPTDCNYFDHNSLCMENTYGPFTVYNSDGSVFTEDAYACTTAANITPFEADPYNEFGLHIIDGQDTKTNHCNSGTATTGHQGYGRLFTTFEGNNSPFWYYGVHSHWNSSGVYNQNGAIFIR